MSVVIPDVMINAAMLELSHRWARQDRDSMGNGNNVYDRKAAAARDLLCRYLDFHGLTGCHLDPR